MNLAIPARQITETAMDRAIRSIETATVPLRAIRAMRAMRRKAVRDLLRDCLSCSEEAAMVKLAWPFYSTFHASETASAAEIAVAVLEGAIRVEKRWQSAGRPRFDVNKLVALKERLVVARYLRRQEARFVSHFYPERGWQAAS